MIFPDVEIAPSILSADFCHLLSDIKEVEPYCKYLHFDVMDGHFVNNISFGLPIMRSIRSKTDLIFDVHLMITNPESFVKPFAEAGADSITFHYECTRDPMTLINTIRGLGKRVGISVHPDTDVAEIFPYIPYVDMVLVMSVVPGLGGQRILADSYDRIRKISEEITRVNSDAFIEVDGGINSETIHDVVSAGASLLVAGSAVFGKNSSSEAIKELLLKARE